MNWIRPDDAGYDDARALFNAMIDRRPAVIAQCAGADDVRQALGLARKHKLPVAVRSGGHSVAGMSMNDDGLVVDVRPMKDLRVDPEARTATVGAGVTWGEFDRSLQDTGLAVTGGRVSTTGVSGFTLGGGSGWLERSCGLACDNLAAVDMVTVDGGEVTASAAENPELFWALHGGGGNFGVATSFTFNLHPLPAAVQAGLLLWPEAAGTDVARAYRDFAPASPERLGSALAFLTAPAEEAIPEHLRGRNVAAVVLLYAGDPGEGAEAIRPLRELQPAADLVQPMPYADFQCMTDDPPGKHNYWTADCHDTFPDQALEVLARYGASRRSELAQLLLVPWGGAVAQVPDDATPLANRSATWVSHPFALWEEPEQTAASIEWARGFRRDVAEFATGGVYLNFIGHEGQDRVRAAFGERNYARLARIKRDWDPENFFRGNQNIEPAG